MSGRAADYLAWPSLLDSSWISINIFQNQEFYIWSLWNLSGGHYFSRLLALNLVLNCVRILRLLFSVLVQVGFKFRI